MSVRLRSYTLAFGACLLPGVALADGLVIPGFGPSEPDGRPSYRQSYNDYPPPQHNFIGQPVPPPSPYARPTYRESNNAFPPAGGRYGGGFIEYVLTGGRPEPITPPAYTAPYPAQQPIYAAPPPVAYVPAPAATSYAPQPTGLPQSGLPDYQPQPPAFYGAPPASYQPSAYNALATGPDTPRTAYDPAAAEPGIVTRPMNPAYERQDVAYDGRERTGTIIIDTPNKFLYLVQPGRHAIRYGIGVGRPGFAWSGVKTISRKAEWPGWTPPPEMLARRPDLPRHMDGGEGNPLGARALYLGSSMYRIHGTNEPYTIGTNVSSGCIRMMNQDVVDLYGRVGVGTRVIVE